MVFFLTKSDAGGFAKEFLTFQRVMFTRLIKHDTYDPIRIGTTPSF